MRALPLCLALALTALPGHPPHAATGCARDAMLVMDASASMIEQGFDATAPTRMAEAVAALRRAMPDIAQMRRVGLLVYGPGGADSCSGISLKFRPVENAANPLIAAVEALAPGGLTPLSGSVEAAAGVLEGRGIVVLVTDGNETCGGRPCTLGRDLEATAPGIEVHVIGFRVENDPFAWDSPEAGAFSGEASVAKCLSDATGGMYVDTQTVEELAAALRMTLGGMVIGHPARPGHRAGTSAG